SGETTADAALAGLPRAGPAPGGGHVGAGRLAVLPRHRRQRAELGLHLPVAGLRRVRGADLGPGGTPGTAGVAPGAATAVRAGAADTGPASGDHPPRGPGRGRVPGRGRSGAGRVQPLSDVAERAPGCPAGRLPGLPTTLAAWLVPWSASVSSRTWSAWSCWC